MIDTSAFTKLVPGFDFLNNLMQNAGQATPAIGQWVAPTLDPAELEKRIGELKTVQFWLEQNARMIGVTVQALEVQRMTLSTLQSMNVDLRNALTLPEAPDSAAAAPAAAAPEPLAASFTRAFADAAAPTPAAAAPAAPSATPDADADAAAAKPAVDPMQWWGALTQQFGELAAKAMQDGRELAERQLAATAPAPAAEPAPARKAAASQPAAKAAAKPAAKAARKSS